MKAAGSGHRSTTPRLTRGEPSRTSAAAERPGPRSASSAVGVSFDSGSAYTRAQSHHRRNGAPADAE